MRPVDPRLLRQAGAARGYLAVTVGLGLLGTVLILLQAGLLATALAGAARGIGIGALAGTLAWLGVVLAGRAAAAAGGEAAALRAAAEVKSGLRRRLSAHALRLGPAWLGGQRAGEIAALATKGLDGLDAYFARYLPQLMLAVVVPLAVVIRVAFADWLSAVIIVVTLPLIPVFGILIGWHTRAQTQRQWRLLAGHIGYQTALLVLLLTPEAYLPLRNVGGQFHASTEGVTAARRAFEILDTPLPARAVTPDVMTADVDLSREDIALHTVTLNHPGRGQPALDEVSLTIRPGELIVLTGPSGAGKSSLLSMLLRFATPTSGVITAGAVDLTQIPADRWRSQIAWVPQHPHLFIATVAENITLGQSGARQEDIVAAARLAGADDFIRRLPDGYDTVLAEGARSLSAGQRQKLALARAFLRPAPVLLLDEPTAHLDPVSADRIMAVIDGQMADRTIILVTHRPPRRWPAEGGRPKGSTRSLVLDHGRLTSAADPVPRAGLAVTP